MPLAIIDLFVLLLPLTILNPTIEAFSAAVKLDAWMRNATCCTSIFTPIGYTALADCIVGCICPPEYIIGALSKWGLTSTSGNLWCLIGSSARSPHTSTLHGYRSVDSQYAKSPDWYGYASPIFSASVVGTGYVAVTLAVLYIFQ